MWNEPCFDGCTNHLMNNKKVGLFKCGKAGVLICSFCSSLSKYSLCGQSVRHTVCITVHTTVLAIKNDAYS